MIDWLVHPEASGPFLLASQGSLSYDDVLEANAVERTGRASALMPERDPDSVLRIYEAVARGPLILGAIRRPRKPALPEETMTVLSTSGTTGEPKLVPLTSRNWEAAVRGSAAHLGHTADDEWLLAMPLHHVGGLSILFRSSHVGARVRMLAKFDPVEFSDALDVVTMASVVPTMLRRILDLDRRHYNGLRAVLVGGGPIPPGLLEEAWERGIPALPTYGMTETCAQVATLRPGSPPAYRAHLLPGVEARIEGDGQIALRGEQIFGGYLSGASPFRDGWFLTGDLGELVEDGSLQVIARVDDVIVTGGENVDPTIVEETVASHPGVTAALVVGLPSPEWGNEVACLFTGSVPAESLEPYVRERLRPFEVPKRWCRVESIPITSTGKPDRAAARKVVARPASD